MKKLLALFAISLFAIQAVACPSTGRYTLDGTWNGWSGKTVFMLTNGQVFKQIEYRYHYEYAYRPEVIIINDGQCKAMIGNADPVVIQQLR